MKNKIIAAVLVLGFAQTAFSTTTLTENEATPDILSEPEAILMITEVNFKNSSADWAEIYYESPSGKSLNLKGISFLDDNSLKTLGDYTAISGQYLLLTFKSSSADKSPYIFTPGSGLTGTSEQLIMRDTNGKIIDAVCWTSSTPTTDEITDMLELYGQNGWHTADISTCVKSETVKNNQSVMRTGFLDTNSSADWLITETLTPAATNPLPETTPVVTTDPITDDENSTSTSESAQITAGETSSSSSAEENSDNNESPSMTDDETVPGPIAQAEQLAEETVAKSAADKKKTTSAPAKSASKKTASATKKSSSKTVAYSDGGLSDNLIVTEIMPNPDGNDGKNEWVEITNTGDEPVNPGNWTLDDGENGSKPHIIPDSTDIAPGAAMLLKITDTKISLGNTEDTVRLSDFNSAVISDISYEEAPSGQAYALTETVNEEGETNSEWLWTDSPTPGEPNPVHTEITAEITVEPVFGEKYFFMATTADGTEHKITFGEKEIQAPLAKATLLKGSKVKMVLVEEEGVYRLVSYEIVSPPPSRPQTEMIVPGIIGSFVTAAGSTVYFLRKRIPWQFLLKPKL